MIASTIATAREAFLVYLGLGLNPLPGWPRSKKTVYPGEGIYSQPASADKIDEWFPSDQPRNIGIANGAPSGNIADVDMDSPEAVALADAFLPPTGWRFRREGATDSGHRIYRTDVPLLCKAREFFAPDSGPDKKKPLVELRGDGGWSIWPPSAHPSGKPIVWESMDLQGGIPVVSLADLTRAVSHLAAASLLLRYWPRTDSNRHALTLALAGGLLLQPWPVEEVEHFVEALSRAAGDPEVRGRVKNVSSTQAAIGQGGKVTGFTRLGELLGPEGKAVVNRVREWISPTAGKTAPQPTKAVKPPVAYRPFPTEALPQPLRRYIEEGALALGCDPSYIALPALAVVASAIGNTRSIRLKRDWHEPPVVWSAIVGDSGTLKSPAHLKAVAYLFRLQKQLVKDFQKEQKQHQEAMEDHAAAKAEARKGGEDPGDPPEEPKLRRVVVNDTTIERLAEVLEDNPRGILMARDELAGWLGSFCRYKGKGGGSDLPGWLEFFRAGSVIIDRKTGNKKTIFIDRAAVSVTGGIQPGTLKRALTSEFLEAGLGARLLFAMPVKVPKCWSEAEIGEETEEAYHTLLSRLMSLEAKDLGEDVVPHAIELSPDAKKIWVHFYNQWGREQAAVEGDLAAAYSKLEAYAARFALLHHIIDRVGRGEHDLAQIEAPSVEAGIILCRWFAQEVQRIYDALTESDEQTSTRKLVEWVQAHGGRTTARKLQNSNSRKWPTRESAEAGLGTLVQAGLGEWVDERRPEGGHPARWFVLKPSDTRQNVWNGEAVAFGSSADQEASCDACHRSGTGRVSEVSDVGRDSGGKSEVAGSGHLYIDDPGQLPSVLVALDETNVVGLDLETTGLDPRADRVRLLTLACDTSDGGTFTYLVDCFAMEPASILEALAGKGIVGHNLGFDLGFLARMGFEATGKVHDLMHLSRILHAGEGYSTAHTLQAVAQRELGVKLDKDLQKSDWSGDLTPAQIAYAAGDVTHLRPLLEVMRKKTTEAGLDVTADVESRCQPAIAWMASKGVAVDRDAWTALVDKAEADAVRIKGEMAALAPVRPQEMFSSWNWDSPADMTSMFQTLGFPVEGTADDVLAGIDHPIAGLLRDYREATKKTGTYGRDWLKHVSADGRVYPSWKQNGADSGRMSCADPNMQQLPRDPAYRRCVVAPPGRVLVKADYSQIELRIAAKVSGDRALLDAYQRGEDLHTRTARSVLGIEAVTKQDRQLAKALNFGLLYGMGAKGFRGYAKATYGLDLTLEQAEHYRSAFFRTYPGLARWHHRVKRERATETRTLLGRRRLLNDKTPDTHRVNTPVQGTGADGLKLALALLWETRHDYPGAFPVLAVHDEIVVECDLVQAEQVADWLRKKMIEAMTPMIDPVPVEVEVKTSRNWAGD